MQPGALLEAEFVGPSFTDRPGPTAAVECPKQVSLGEAGGRCGEW